VLAVALLEMPVRVTLAVGGVRVRPGRAGVRARGARARGARAGSRRAGARSRWT